MNSLKGKIAVITGASSGIGKAVALRLAREQVNPILVGRNLERLQSVANEAKKSHVQTQCFNVDLTIDLEIHKLTDFLVNQYEALDILVHSAGIITLGRIESANIEDFDLQYRTNVRAPFLLTQRLMPLLLQSHGQIVFINSSAGLQAGQNTGQYAATKFALRALADSLRAEMNSKGLRVLSVYPGRTATPMQATVFASESRTYRPENLLQPEDVASSVQHALKLPETAELTDLCIRPFQKAL